MSAIGRVFRAYPTLLRIGLADAVAYRAEMIVWMLTTTMPLVSLALWSNVAAAGPIGRYDQHGFLAYFLATLTVRQLTGCWLVWELNQEIRSGAIARRLLKPVHPLIAFSAENLAAMPLRAAICAPIAIIALYTIGHEAPRSPAMIAAWIVSMLGAWLINFTTMAAMGSLAFFLESSTAIFELWLVAFMALSGYLLPLDLFPPGLAEIAHALPFRYTMALPVEIAIGKLSGADVLRELAYQWAYAAAFLALGLYLFRVGVRRYASFGG
jgi:ABC-2 type transport system permease protein